MFGGAALRWIEPSSKLEQSATASMKYLDNITAAARERRECDGSSNPHQSTRFPRPLHAWESPLGRTKSTTNLFGAFATSPVNKPKGSTGGP
jgi:hypothetical protein